MANRSAKSETSDNEWQDTNSPLSEYIRIAHGEILGAYKSSRNLIIEHYQIEQSVNEGGYGTRQLLELIQNARDAVYAGKGNGRIAVILTAKYLYCANTGKSFDESGVTALLHAYMSSKIESSSRNDPEIDNQIGRFGIGFKSVLGISTTIDIFSRSVSFGFDRKDSTDVITQAIPNAGHKIPGLRLAFVRDIFAARQYDSLLDELARWATTIVRVRTDGAYASRLSDDIKHFPDKFLLFNRRIKQIYLDDRITNIRKVLTITRNRSGSYTINNGTNNPDIWNVFERQHEVSDEALADAGPTVGRKSIVLTWAAPAAVNRQKPGEYWAFFPTAVVGSFQGIVNGTWKTNPDRQGLLEGTYNNELLHAFAGLIVQSSAKLSNENDMARHLDYFPAEPGPGASWWNKTLDQNIQEIGKSHPLIPDEHGTFHLASDVKLPPSKATSSALDIWDADIVKKDGWAHRSAYSTPVRHARSKRFGSKERTIREWLFDAVAYSPESSIGAIRIANELFAEINNRAEIKSASFVLIVANTRTVTIPDSQRLFFDDHSININTQYWIVHPIVAANEEARRILNEVFGIRNIDVADLLRAHLNDQVNNTKDQLYIDRTWQLVDKCEENLAVEIVVSKKNSISVRCVDGIWRNTWAVLLPSEDGIYVDGTPEACMIDLIFHRNHGPILEAAGVVREPSVDGCEPWLANELLQKYNNWGSKSYVSSAGGSYSPEPRDDNGPSAGPLQVASLLHGEARKIYIRKLLELAKNDRQIVWWNSANYRKNWVSLASPAQWVFLTGVYEIESSLGPRAARLCVDGSLSQWEDILPVAEKMSFLKLCDKISKLPYDMLQMSYSRCLELGNATRSAEFYLEACRNELERPNEILASVNGQSKIAAFKDVSVTHVSSIMARISLGASLLIVPTIKDAQEISDRWSCNIAVCPSSIESRGELSEEKFIEKFMSLSHPIARRCHDIRLIECDDILLEFNDDVTSLDCHWNERDQIFRYKAAIPLAKLLEYILGELGFDREQINKEIEAAQAAAHDERYVELRNAASDEHRLAQMLPPEVLIEKFPSDIKKIIDLDPLSTARVAFALFGTFVLAKYKVELRGHGFSAPSSWAGTKPALDFVRRCGFDDSFAGIPKSHRSSFIDIDGPIVLGTLHPYQSLIAGNIKKFLSQELPGRAFLSIPTGSGKTRVVVEALVNALKERILVGHILWIADREELCDQAIQAWTEVWRWKGSASTLRISREWGGLDGARLVGSTESRVVVATIQTLRARVGDRASTWVDGAACIVIDEAHTATTSSFTSILSELGLSRGKTTRPLIGLSATPYRGRDSSVHGETQALVNRFGGNRLDKGIFDNDDPYPHLKKMGVLSEAEFEVIPGGKLEFTSDDVGHFEKFREISSSMESRIARDISRTNRIVERITQIESGWPIIVFAVSVAHAEVLAGLLAVRGVVARAISGDTDQHARRDAIARFRDGRVQVLTNYGVLIAGFDAPKTRAIVVARPIFSPGVYMQAIGRGLRGPLNGGTEHCLIINVEDNFDRFGDQLAFRELERLWGMGPKRRGASRV